MKEKEKKYEENIYSTLVGWFSLKKKILVEMFKPEVDMTIKQKTQILFISVWVNFNYVCIQRGSTKQNVDRS